MPNPDGTPTDLEILQARADAALSAGKSMLTGAVAGQPGINGPTIPGLGTMGLPKPSLPPGAVPPPQAPIGPPVDEVPTQAPIPAGGETSDWDNENLVRDEATKRAAYGDMGPGPLMPGVVPSYEDFTKLGGAEGGENYREIDRGMARYAKALDEQADIVGQQGQAKADIYKNQHTADMEQLAAITRNRQERQEQIQAAQQKLDAGMQNYSNQLSDSGAAWNNPHSIMSAIAVAFTALGGGDSLGMQKLISDQVNADFMRRKALADMHLGELRSNVAMYRAIAGDKDLGDQWALAESHRIASEQIGRISEQFQGPLAKSKGAVLKEAEAAQSNLIKMKIYAEMVHHAPAREQFLGQKTELAAEGQAMPPGVGPTPYKGSWQAGAVKPGLPNVSLSGGSGASASNGPAPVGAAIATLTGKKAAKLVPSELAAMYESRSPGAGKAVETMLQGVYDEARVTTGRAGLMDSSLVQKKRVELVNQAFAERAAIGKAAVEAKLTDPRAWGELSRDISRVKAAAQLAYPGDPSGPDKFLGDMRRFAGKNWSNYIQNLRQRFGDRSNPHSAQAMANLDAAERFHQNMGDKMIGFYHKRFGGTMSTGSEGELSLGKLVISPEATFQKMEGFVDMQAKEAGNDWQRLLASAGSSRGALLMRAEMGLGVPRVDSPGTR